MDLAKNIDPGYSPECDWKLLSSSITVEGLESKDKQDKGGLVCSLQTFVN